jgi:hypothetical protein
LATRDAYEEWPKEPPSTRRETRQFQHLHISLCLF